MTRHRFLYTLIAIVCVAGLQSSAFGTTRDNTFSPFELPLSTVVLDAGHGGHDPGATVKWHFAPDGMLNEKDFTWELAALVQQKLLQKDSTLSVVLTRTDDSFVPLDYRAAMARAVDPGVGFSSLLVSIHANSASSPEASGYEFLIKQLNKKVRFLDEDSSNWHVSRYAIFSQTELNALLNRANLLLGQAMETALQAFFPSDRNRGIKEQDVWVLNASCIPSILVETSFISNESDARKMLDTVWKDSMADAIVDGILRYRDLLR
jgi:N-acetylmuramoyl-L-alanine amidase